MIDYVVDREYFHVTRSLHYNNHAPLAIGAVIDVGTKHNPFFGFYEGVRAYPVTTPTGQVQCPAIKFLKSVRDGMINCPNIALIAVEVADHYVVLARELILEQVRIETAPHAPSRQKCLWLADTLDEAKFWKERLGAVGSIARLQVSGIVHRADAFHLLGDSEPLTTTYDRAHRYWRGEPSSIPELETLFCGTAKIVEISD